MQSVKARMETEKIFFHSIRNNNEHLNLNATRSLYLPRHRGTFFPLNIRRFVNLNFFHKTRIIRIIPRVRRKCGVMCFFKRNAAFGNLPKISAYKNFSRKDSNKRDKTPNSKRETLNHYSRQQLKPKSAEIPAKNPLLLTSRRVICFSLSFHPELSRDSRRPAKISAHFPGRDRA